MAGKFYLSYTPKPVITLAPDAYVFINGDMEIPICGQCGRKGRFWDDVTDISVSLGVTSAPGNATVTIVAPRTKESRYFSRGRCHIIPMQEIEIYMKGRFLSKDAKPRYYPVFWGLVSSVSDSYSNGQHTIQINCSDVLRWLQIMKTNLMPQFIDDRWVAQAAHAQQQFHMNHMTPQEMIWELLQITNPRTDIGPDVDIIPPTMEEGNIYKQIPGNRYGAEDMINYWAWRFRKAMRSAVIFAMKKGSMKSHEAEDERRCDKNMYTRTAEYQGPTYRFAMDTELYKEFTFAYTRDLLGELQHLGDMNRLEAAQYIANMVHWEFYMDVTGQIIFKPPFYNLDVRPHFPVSWILDTDIVNWDFREDEKEVRATRIDTWGSMYGMMQVGKEKWQPFGTAIDYQLAHQFGLRQARLDVPFISDGRQAKLYGMAEMDRLNARRHSGSITIPGRPELRIGFPIYIEPRDAFYYISGLSHNFSFSGMTFTTSLQLEAARRLVTEADGTTPAVNKALVAGSVQTIKNVPPEDLHAPASSQKDPSKCPEAPKDWSTNEKDIAEEHRGEGSVYVKFERWGIGVDSTPHATLKSIPLTDECGYEHFGGQNYGRNMMLQKNGAMVKGNPGVCEFTAEGKAQEFAEIAHVTTLRGHYYKDTGHEEDNHMVSFENVKTAISKKYAHLIGVGAQGNTGPDSPEALADAGSQTETCDCIEDRDLNKLGY